MRVMGNKTPWLMMTPSILPKVSTASSVTLNAVFGQVSEEPFWCPDLADIGFGGVAHIGDGHVSRQVRDLRRELLLQILELLGRPRDENHFVVCRQQVVGNGEADAAASTGDDNDLGFHLSR